MEAEGKKSDFELIMEAIDRFPSDTDKYDKIPPRPEDLRVIGERGEFMKVIDKDNYRVKVEVDDFIEDIFFFSVLPYYVATAIAAGEDSIYTAMKSALNALPVDMENISRMLFCITGSGISAEDIGTIMSFWQELPEDMDVCWGTALDETLPSDHIKATLVAAGKYDRRLWD